MSLYTLERQMNLIECKNPISQPSNRYWVVKDPLINSQIHVWPWADSESASKGVWVSAVPPGSLRVLLSPAPSVCMGTQ